MSEAGTDAKFMMKQTKKKNKLRYWNNSLLINRAFLSFILFFLAAYANGQSKLAEQPNPPGRFSAVETGFITIPDSIQTSVYWYWISDNISKEGVVKDLEAMK